MSFEDDMASYEAEWEKQNVEGGGDLEDGTHQARIAVCRVEQKDWGWTWSIRYEEINGKGGVWANYNLDDETSREFAARTAATLGYVAPLSGLAEACAAGQFDDLTVEIYVKTKPGDKRDFKNAYANKVIGRESGEPVASRAAGASDDDSIPF